jgi:hypothetical protein
LVKQGFARAGGKDRKDVVPVENGADDLRLSRPEIFVAEPIALPPDFRNRVLP